MQKFEFEDFHNREENNCEILNLEFCLMCRKNFKAFFCFVNALQGNFIRAHNCMHETESWLFENSEPSHPPLLQEVIRFNFMLVKWNNLFPLLYRFFFNCVQIVRYSYQQMSMLYEVSIVVFKLVESFKQANNCSLIKSLDYIKYCIWLINQMLKWSIKQYF